MKRNTMLKILNPLLAVLLINQAATGALHDVMSEELFEVLHEGGGVLLILGVICHVALNWNWIKANFLKSKDSPAPLGDAK